mmetsp:Transcript_10047/g.32738  ORF Transcript_10047/g.32738 Transcript_10047/m.32738 type:complete len:220 (-) Transcript_10047:1251-1910(-)
MAWPRSTFFVVVVVISLAAAKVQCSCCRTRPLCFVSLSFRAALRSSFQYLSRSLTAIAARRSCREFDRRNAASRAATLFWSRRVSARDTTVRIPSSRSASVAATSSARPRRWSIAPSPSTAGSFFPARSFAYPSSAAQHSSWCCASASANRAPILDVRRFAAATAASRSARIDDTVASCSAWRSRCCRSCVVALAARAAATARSSSAEYSASRSADSRS